MIKRHTLNNSTEQQFFILEGSDESELRLFLEETSLDEGLVRDAFDPNEIPRAEKEDGICYFYIRFPLIKKREGKNILYNQTALIAFSSKVLAFVSEIEPFYSEKCASIAKKSSSTLHVLFELFTLFSKEYSHQIRTINKTLRDQVDSSDSITNKQIILLVEYERILNEFISALLPATTYLRELAEGKYVSLGETDADIAEDIYLLYVQLSERSKSTLRYVKNIRDALTTIMSNDLNRAIRLLTTLTVLLAVPTLIVGFYGMNIQLPGSRESSTWLVITSILILVSGILLYFFKRKNII